MLVGVPKEIKSQENRVGLVPASVREVIRAGGRVLVETNAGLGIGISDEDYQASGAEIVATADEIFAGYYDVQKKVGKDEMKNIPFGTIASWTLADKLAAGLQQLMAGARKFNLKEISRDDIYAANRETAKETGIIYITDKNDEVAKKIIKS